LRVSSLKASRDHEFLIEPDAKARKALAQEISLEALRKLRFEGRVVPYGKRGWSILARLGATVVQPCVVTLEPVTTRIDTDVTRHLLPESLLDQFEEGSETELTEDENKDVLEDEIDLPAMMAEALVLALPTYPRKEDAALDQTSFAGQGIAPLKDEDLKPFAGLAALRDKMQGNDGED
jgi:uncharacterized metal-binding protein YceD (DUF177 family)